ncbi:MAG: hypothetical protein OXS28_20575 [Gammaproteobacteria bacterium]|nr:hypothetical protein [Gammaproteobacteria bacterium]
MLRYYSVGVGYVKSIQSGSSTGSAGHAMSFGPDQAPLCACLHDKAEGLLYAGTDMGAIATVK